jgi:hypothetical protein
MKTEKMEYSFMTRFKNISSLAVILLAFSFGKFATAATETTNTQQDVGAWLKKDWPGKTWSRDDISSFLTQLTESDEAIHLGDFKFFSPENDSEYDLAASIDESGRGFFNTIVIVRKLDKGFSYQTVQAWDVKSLDGLIKDVDGDRKKELLVPTGLTPYMGTRPVAVVPIVYGREKGIYVNKSANYSAYYRTEVVPLLQQKLDKLKSAKPGSLELDIAQIELDKVLRTSGQDPKAGLTQAQTWSKEDKIHQELAASVLQDIGSKPPKGQ